MVMKAADVQRLVPGDEPPSFCADCAKHGSCLFANLPEELFQRYLDMRQARFYARGTTIVETGDEVRGIYVVCTGTVRLSRLNPEGQVHTVAHLEVGDLFGVRELMLGHRHQFTATMMQSGKVFFLPRRTFVPLITQEHSVAMQVLIKLSEEIYDWAERVWAHHDMDSSDRLLRTLVTLAESQGSPESRRRTDLPLTVRELSESIGCSRQWTSRTLKELEVQGLLYRQRGLIVLTPKAFEVDAQRPDARGAEG